MIDITPTWSAILPLMIRALLTNRNPESQETVITEFERMAKLADAYVEYRKDRDEVLSEADASAARAAT